MSQGQSGALKQEEFRGDQLKLGTAPCWGDTELTSVPSRTVIPGQAGGKVLLFLPTKQGQDGLENLGGKP